MASNKKSTELSNVKIIGILLELIGVPFLILVAVLLNMENKDLGGIDVLLVVGASTFFIGLVLSHLPQEEMEENQW